MPNREKGRVCTNEMGTRRQACSFSVERAALLFQHPANPTRNQHEGDLNVIPRYIYFSYCCYYSSGKNVILQYILFSCFWHPCMALCTLCLRCKVAKPSCGYRYSNYRSVFSSYMGRTISRRKQIGYRLNGKRVKG